MFAEVLTAHLSKVIFVFTLDLHQEGTYLRFTKKNLKYPFRCTNYLVELQSDGVAKHLKISFFQDTFNKFKWKLLSQCEF